MKLHAEVAAAQAAFHRELRAQAAEFVAGVDKTSLAAILLSGSVARGDFFPGRWGGMVDLTVMTKPGSAATAAEVFGPNEDPGIPFHCVNRRGTWYQIAFHGALDQQGFAALNEAQKFAWGESEILWEDGTFAAAWKDLGDVARREQAEFSKACLGTIGYLLSEYKEDRWMRREAYPQLQANLSTAVQLALKGLYYLNGFYAPAEDRRLYYAYSLARLPRDFASLMEALHRQDLASLADYRRRKALFEAEFLAFLVQEPTGVLP